MFKILTDWFVWLKEIHINVSFQFSKDKKIAKQKMNILINAIKKIKYIVLWWLNDFDAKIYIKQLRKKWYSWIVQHNNKQIKINKSNKVVNFIKDLF